MKYAVIFQFANFICSMVLGKLAQVKLSSEAEFMIRKKYFCLPTEC